MTFIYELNPYPLNVYPQTKNELSTSTLSKALQKYSFYAHSPIEDAQSSVSLCVECYFNYLVDVKKLLKY